MQVNNLPISEFYTALEGSQSELSASGRIYVHFKDGSFATWAEVTERLFELGADCLFQNFSRQDRIRGHKAKIKLIEFWENAQDKSPHTGLINRICYLVGCIMFEIRRQFQFGSEFHIYESRVNKCYQRSTYFEELNEFEYFQGFINGSPDYFGLFDSKKGVWETKLKGESREVEYYCLRGIDQFAFF